MSVDEDSDSDSDVVMTRSSTPGSTTTQATDVSGLLAAIPHYPDNVEIRPYHVIFIPDPTLAMANKLSASNDLAFIKCRLSDAEYEAVKHLEGSVHQSGKYYILQEWVCIFCTVTSAIN